MKCATKKITGLFFLLLGMAPLLCSLAVSVRKQEIHQRMKAALEDKQLQTVMVPEKEVVFMDDHEIWVNNHLFDIHTKQLENGIYVFTGLYDEDETNLVNKEKNPDGKNNQQAKLLSQLFKSLPVFHDHPGETAILSSAGVYTDLVILASPSRSMEILTPPPQS